MVIIITNLVRENDSASHTRTHTPSALELPETPCTFVDPFLLGQSDEACCNCTCSQAKRAGKSTPPFVSTSSATLPSSCVQGSTPAPLVVLVVHSHTPSPTDLFSPSLLLIFFLPSIRRQYDTFKSYPPTSAPPSFDITVHAIATSTTNASTSFATCAPPQSRAYLECRAAHLARRERRVGKYKRLRNTYHFRRAQQVL
jgi:hypothetical protein